MLSKGTTDGAIDVTSAKVGTTGRSSPVASQGATTLAAEWPMCSANISLASRVRAAASGRPGDSALTSLGVLEGVVMELPDLDVVEDREGVVG